MLDSESQEETFIGGLNDAQRSLLRELQDSGLRVATIPFPAVYEPQGDGSVQGLHYDMLMQMSEELSIPVEITVYDNPIQFLALDGEIPQSLFSDPDMTYTPDLFAQADLYLVSLTVLPWREQILTMIPVLPVQNAVVVRADSPVENLEDLDGLRIMLPQASAQMEIAEQLMDEFGLEFEITANDELSFGLAELSRGETDFALTDITQALAFNRRRIDNRLAVRFPVGEVDYIAWAVSPERIDLGELILLYIEDLKTRPRFNELFDDYYGISADAYLGLLNLR